MSSISNIREAIESYAAASGMSESKIVEKLERHYFNKRVSDNLKLYKKGKKKVSEITRDLKMSPRKFYAILEQKKIPHKKYNKNSTS